MRRPISQHFMLRIYAAYFLTIYYIGLCLNVDGNNSVNSGNEIQYMNYNSFEIVMFLFHYSIYFILKMSTEITIR